jgi:hypothetical protein
MVKSCSKPASERPNLHACMVSVPAVEEQQEAMVRWARTVDVSAAEGCRPSPRRAAAAAAPNSSDIVVTDLSICRCAVENKHSEIWTCIVV